MRAAPVALTAFVVSALACTCSQPPPPVAPGTPNDTGEILVGPEPGKARKGKAKAGKGKRPGEGKAKRPAPRPEPAPEPKPGTGRPAGLEYVGDGVWNVERSLVDGWVAAPETLGARATDRPGEGFEIAGVAEGEDAWYLGVRNGDLLTTANGRSLADPRARLDLLGELEHADTVDLGFVRRGVSESHRYRISP